jgi:Flp pilus assembly pilin Flp
MNTEVHMRQWFKPFHQNSSGQELVEYSLLLAFVALVAIIGLLSLGMSINVSLTTEASTLLGTTQAAPVARVAATRAAEIRDVDPVATTRPAAVAALVAGPAGDRERAAAATELVTTINLAAR